MLPPDGSGLELNGANMTYGNAGVAGSPRGRAPGRMVALVAGIGAALVLATAGPATASVPAPDQVGPVVTVDDASGPIVVGSGNPEPTVTYVGAWTHQTNVAKEYGAFAATQSMTSQAGAYVDVSFFGTSIAWYGAKESWLGGSSVSLDGVAQGSVSQYLPSSVGDLAQALLFSRVYLALGWHDLRLVKTDTSARSLQVDAFTYNGFVQPGSYATATSAGALNTTAFFFVSGPTTGTLREASDWVVRPNQPSIRRSMPPGGALAVRCSSPSPAAGW